MKTETSLPTIALVSRVVTKVCDRILGDRIAAPLLVCAATVEALRGLGIESRIYYGPAAWIEILEDQTPLWAGCWGQSQHFWVGTAWGETVDLTVGVAYRKHPDRDLSEFEKAAEDDPRISRARLRKSILSAPMIWSREVPRFYRYQPEGVAEIDEGDLSPRDRGRFDQVIQEIREKCRPENVGTAEAHEFPEEALICSGRKILDDAAESFKHFDRALAVAGIPPAPELRAH